MYRVVGPTDRNVKSTAQYQFCMSTPLITGVTTAFVTCMNPKH